MSWRWPSGLMFVEQFRVEPGDRHGSIVRSFFHSVQHVFLRRIPVTVGFSGGLFRISHVPGPEHLDGSQRVHSAH